MFVLIDIACLMFLVDRKFRFAIICGTKDLRIQLYLKPVIYVILIELYALKLCSKCGILAVIFVTNFIFSLLSLVFSLIFFFITANAVLHRILYAVVIFNAVSLLLLLVTLQLRLWIHLLGGKLKSFFFDPNISLILYLP